MSATEYWFCKSAISATVAKALTYAAALDNRFLPALELFHNRALCFLALALSALAHSSSKLPSSLSGTTPFT